MPSIDHEPLNASAPLPSPLRLCVELPAITTFVKTAISEPVPLVFPFQLKTPLPSQSLLAAGLLEEMRLGVYPQVSLDLFSAEFRFPLSL